MNMYDPKTSCHPGAVGPATVPDIPAIALGGPALPRPAEDSSVKGENMRPPENDRRRAGNRLAGGRSQQFPGAYLTEDVRVIRGADVPSTMLREGLRS